MLVEIIAGKAVSYPFHMRLTTECMLTINARFGATSIVKNGAGIDLVRKMEQALVPRVWVEKRLTALKQAYSFALGTGTRNQR